MNRVVRQQKRRRAPARARTTGPPRREGPRRERPRRACGAPTSAGALRRHPPPAPLHRRLAARWAACSAACSGPSRRVSSERRAASEVRGRASALALRVASSRRTSSQCRAKLVMRGPMPFMEWVSCTHGPRYGVPVVIGDSATQPPEGSNSGRAGSRSRVPWPSRTDTAACRPPSNKWYGRDLQFRVRTRAAGGRGLAHDRVAEPESRLVFALGRSLARPSRQHRGERPSRSCWSGTTGEGTADVLDVPTYELGARRVNMVPDLAARQFEGLRPGPRAVRRSSSCAPRCRRPRPDR